jgi:hypothetical protein
MVLLDFCGTVFRTRKGQTFYLNLSNYMVMNITKTITIKINNNNN